MKTLSLSICFTVQQVLCLGYYPAAGAGAISMGGTGLMQADIFCGVNNCALMPGIRKAGIGFSFTNRYAISDLNQVSVCAVLPYKKSAYGCEVLSNGNNVLNDRTLGLSFAHAPHRQFSFGLGANYHFYSIVGYGKSSAITMEFSLHTLINEKLSSSFAVFNPLGSKLNNKTEEMVLRTFRLGVQYKVNAKVNLAAEAEKNHIFKTNIKLGCHYQLNPGFYFNMGFSSLPTQCSLGMGCKQKQYTIAIASTIGFTPGISNTLSLIYEIGE